MRMRKRHNLQPRMERCSAYLVTEPERLRGCWRESDRPLLVEIGCGKGMFTCRLAQLEPGCDVVALEKVPDAMILAMERAQKENIENLRFMDFDAGNLREVFASGEVSRIYLNFSDPWPKSRDAKFRLTAPAFLRSYADVLPQGGEVHFKTDNLPFFRWSLEQFSQENWELRDVTEDLHAAGLQGILTDYENRFVREGVPICRLVAVRRGDTLDGSAGVPPRLRDAALADAWGNRQAEQKEAAGGGSFTDPDLKD